MKLLRYILFPVLSWGPLAWTILILICAKFYWTSVRDLFVWIAVYYVFFGLAIWLLSGIILKWKKAITTRQLLIHVAALLIGMLCAYSSIHFDVFSLSGAYID